MCATVLFLGHPAVVAARVHTACAPSPPAQQVKQNITKIQNAVIAAIINMYILFRLHQMLLFHNATHAPMVAPVMEPATLHHVALQQIGQAAMILALLNAAVRHVIKIDLI